MKDKNLSAVAVKLAAVHAGEDRWGLAMEATRQRWVEVAARADELLGMTDAERRLLDFVVAENWGGHLQVYAEAVRRERAPQPRWVLEGGGVRDYRTGYRIEYVPVEIRPEVLRALNAAEPA